ncbi:hypothetical protein H9Q74_000060 [Fusarium xylarioides]|nr:hypothetical protein H9Q71_000160 [Fusarium xylarioides]KAG5829907.1 hypothetical protein H9Q74_000060 [Fusarium xylarioides]
MASGSFYHAAVNALHLYSRRAHMNAFFMHLGIWVSAGVAKTREECVEMYCEFLNEQGYTSIAQEYFEYQVDTLVWYTVQTVPPKQVNFTTQASLVYRDWIRCNSHPSDVEDRGDANPKESTEAQEQQGAAPEDEIGTSQAPSTLEENAEAGPSNRVTVTVPGLSKDLISSLRKRSMPTRRLESRDETNIAWRALRAKSYWLSEVGEDTN